MPGFHPQPPCDLLHDRKAKPVFVAARDLLPTVKVAPVRQAYSACQCGSHDATRAFRDMGLPVDDLVGNPCGNHGLVPFQRAVADKEAEEISFRFAVGAAPREQLAMIVDDDPVSRAQGGRRGPLFHDVVPEDGCRFEDRVITSET
jgi:hypothetical protein